MRQFPAPLALSQRNQEQPEFKVTNIVQASSRYRLDAGTGSAAADYRYWQSGLPISNRFFGGKIV
jgi:hypothetical protein